MAGFYDPGNPQANTHFDVVAAARVVIRDEPVANWQLALKDGQDDTDLAADEFYGYPVDGGMGSFGSPEVFDARPGDDRSEQLVDLASELHDDDEAAVYTDEATGNNLVFFRSGGGDGRYATWMGRTAAGEVACFLTDFGPLTWPRQG